MTGSRIADNQRRAALGLIAQLEPRLSPGRPFLPEVRGTIALNKGFGARDRRLYRELIFTWLRFRAWFDGARQIAGESAAMNLLVALAPDSPETSPLQSAAGVPGGVSLRNWTEARPRLVALAPGFEPELRALLPGWFEGHCPELFQEAELLTQLTRPPLWLRSQGGSAGDLVHELARTQVAAEVSDRVPGAVRVLAYPDLETHPLVEAGRAEVQDIGSQALLAMAKPEPGSNWLDLCAGAGGKSLQLADMLGPKGRVTAHDRRRDALVELRRRMFRAGLRTITIEPVLREPGTVKFDGVLVDAPCSASGTWRRHPFLRHQTNLPVVLRHAREQLDLLHQGAGFVADCGRLLYATCSLSRRENEDVVTKFLEADRNFILERPAWLPERATKTQAGWVTLLPSQLDGDGYFLACLRRRW
jgi:16S rRNA (cytosine967-C5)-methyltransferase